MKEIIAAFFGSIFPGILFNIDRRKLLWTGLSGAIGWMAYAWMLDVTGKIIFSTFFGAIFVGLYSESMARIMKSPATLFSISGIFPLVPGIGAYETVQFMVESKLSQAANKGLETIASAAAIAFGIMLMSAVFRIVIRVRSRLD
jgi:uncharacterized membrane protein YjjB (DUF3815 family)